MKKNRSSSVSRQFHSYPKSSYSSDCRISRTISNTISKHLPAIVPLHFAFVTIKLVVGTTNKLPLSTTDLVAERSSATMLCWNLNYPLTACLTLQMAKGSERI